MKSRTRMVLRSLRPEIRQIMNFKVTALEEKRIKELADEYALGNVSGWIRHCAMNYQPSPHELVEAKQEES